MKTTETVLASVQRTFPAPRGYQGQFIITAQAYQLGGNKHPHFSVTGAIGTAHQLQTGGWQSGGCLHDEALKAWPAIKPLIDLHLSNADDGEPMYAEANGWYWMAGALGGAGEQYYGDKGEAESLRICAEHLRISVEEVESLRGKCSAAFDLAANLACLSTETDIARKHRNEAGRKAGRAVFAAFVEAQRPRWAQEAKDGLAMLKALATA